MAEKNTNLNGVDFTQDPNDFLNIVDGKTVIEENEENTTSKSAAETIPKPTVVAPLDNADKTADEKKPVEEKNLEQKTPNEEPPKEEQVVIPKKEVMTPEEFRQKEAARMIQRQGEERKRAMMAHVEAAKANPEHIHTIAKIDKKLAGEVVKEIWGYSDYDELLAQSKIAEIKAVDPDRGELEERILRLELDRKKEAASAKEQLEKSFFTSKGFEPTPFDPRYVRVIEKLSLLNPSFVASDYSAALAEAYRMSAGEEVVVKDSSDIQKALSNSTPPAVPNSIKQPHETPSIYGEGTQSFANLLGVKLS